MDAEIKLNDISNDLLIINKHTIDTLFHLENAADCVALYVFYYKTAKWQKTNTIKANDAYVKKSLNWGADRIKRTKQTLKEHGLIDIVQRRKDGKIAGWYVEVSYLVAQRAADDIGIKVVDDSNNTQNQQVENATSGSQEINALKLQIKCLKKENDMLKNKIKNEQPAEPAECDYVSEFNELWQQYPRKQGKAKALEAYKRARKAGVDKTTVLDGITRYNAQITANKTKAKYIMQGSTWFNGKRWEDEYTDQPKTQPKTKQEQIDDDYLKYLESLG